ncbi:MAG: DUF1016 family protein [Deltaproteobacteria bacterium]|nr:DUF1016 family protein [Deltaproteobacteria bacterium]
MKQLVSQLPWEHIILLLQGVKDPSLRDWYIGLRHPDDKPTIGLLLCRSKSRLVVEYALRDMNKPIGVAQWETQITRALPKELASSLPSIEQLETALQSELTNKPETARGRRR